MAEPEIRGLWRARLRWRLRGATLWPAFYVAIVVDAVLLHVLPIAGDGAPGVVPAVLLAAFFNLLVVAAGAPLAGMWLRRRRPALPRMIADDRAGTALLAVVAVVLAGLGVLHRPALNAARDAFGEQAAAVRAWVATQAPPAYRANVNRADTWKQGPNLYRTCVPGPDPRRALCLIVFTDQHPPAVQRDPDQRPNSVVAGPDNPGRQVG
jgi:hypothetical protein